MKAVTITGATGFVGSHILENIQDIDNDKFKVIASCRNQAKLPDFYNGNVLVGDLLNDQYIDDLTKKSDIICHTASWAEMNGSVEKSVKYFLNPTINLINSAIKNGVKRFVFLSAITSNPITRGELHTNKPIEKIWAHYYSILEIEKYLESQQGKGMEIIILRVGFFTGKNYSLGLLPILLPRLKTHLVPWIKKGKTTLPLIDGKDIGLAFKLTIKKEKFIDNFTIIDIVGKEIPTVREVFNYLHQKYHYPLPHFSVSFQFAYAFARFMRYIYKFLPSDPLIVPAIVLLLEETHSTNKKAEELLNYKPNVHWKESIDIQIAEMFSKKKGKMRMNK